MAIEAAQLQIGVAVVGAQLAVNVLTDLASRTIAAGQAALSSYTSYERLSMSLESLVAREKVRNAPGLAMTTAIKMARGEAQQLLGWMQRLAVASPFSSESVAQAFRLAQSYGFVSDSADKAAITAKRVTQAIIDFSAGSGQSSEAMSRIALALGQIQAKGKLSGEELLQLTEAGLDARQILSRAFKVPTEELVRMQERGLIPAGKAIKALVEGMEKDFGGAAARQGGTLAGLMESFSDLQQITQRKLFGPFFEVAKDELTKLVNYLQSNDFTVLIDDMSVQIGNIAKETATAFNTIGPYFEGFKSTVVGTGRIIQDTLGGISRAAASLPGAGDLGSGLLDKAAPLALGVVAAMKLRAQATDTVAASVQGLAAKSVQAEHLMADAKTAMLATYTKESELRAQKLKLSAQGTASAEDELAVMRKEYELSDAQAESSKRLTAAKQGQLTTVDKLRGSVNSLNQSFAGQALAGAAITVVVAAMTEKLAEYNAQVQRQAQAVLGGERSQLDALANKLDAPTLTADEQRIEKAANDVRSLIQQAREAELRATQEVAAQAQQVAVQSLIADVGDVVMAVYKPMMLAVTKMTELLFSGLRAVAEKIDPEWGAMFAGLEARAKATGEQLASDTNPLRLMADDAQQALVAYTNTAKTEGAARNAVIDSEITKYKQLQATITTTQAITAVQQQAITAIATMETEFAQDRVKAERGLGKQLADITRTTHKQLADLEKQHREQVKEIRNGAAREATDALGAIIQQQASFMTGVMDREDAYLNQAIQTEGQRDTELDVLRKQGAHNEMRRRRKQYAEQQEAQEAAYTAQEAQAARAYAEQIGQQNQALGRMLVDYVRAQGMMTGVSQDKLDTMTSALRTEYGMQESLAERAFGKSRKALDAWLASGGKNTDATVARLGEYRDEATKTTMDVDKLTQVQSAALADQFAAGTITLDEYTRRLAEVPKAVSKALNLTQEGKVQSDKLVALEKDTAARRKQIAVTQYNEQVAAARKSFGEQQKAAEEAYILQRATMEKNLAGMTESQRKYTDVQISELVRAQVALTAMTNKDFERVQAQYARGKLTRAQYMEELRRISRENALIQSAMPKPGATNQVTPTNDANRPVGPAKPRAAGGPVDADRLYLVGEQGPELIMPRRNGTVVPARQTAAMMGGSGGTSSVTINFTGVTIDSAARADEIARKAARYAQQALSGQLDTVILQGAN